MKSQQETKGRSGGVGGGAIEHREAEVQEVEQAPVPMTESYQASPSPGVTPGDGPEHGAEVRAGEGGGEAAAPAPAAPAAAGAPPNVRDADQEYTIARGDTLYRIAETAYGQAGLWRSVYRCNRGPLGKDPNRILAGTKITLPSLESIISTSASGQQVLWAFEAYWNVGSSRVDGARRWSPDILRHIHVQMKSLPDQDTRNGVWQGLQLTNSEALRDRAAWDGSNFIVGQNADTTSELRMGYGTYLIDDAAVGARTITVVEPARFQVNDTIAIDRSSEEERDTGKITAIADQTYTLDTPLAHAHSGGAEVSANDASGMRNVNWLAATVRHEIGHAVETAMGGVTGFTQGLGGWWTGDEIDTWAGAMSNPWGTGVVSEEDKTQIKQAIVDAVNSGARDLEASVADDHPLKREFYNGLEIIDAASICLSQGDNFFQSPDLLVHSGGKVFSISNWYKTFMYHNEEVANQRVSEYSLYAPAEFFAEAYTVFYEEAGQEGVTEDQYGRLIRHDGWRSWIRTNVHERGLTPATDAESGGATPGGAAVGRHAGNPGQ